MKPNEVIIDKIYLIRGQKVMLDRDLAELYQVETRTMNQAVKRHISRFPEDFMFQMTNEELENWISQIVTSNSIKMGLRKPPLCFTEQGVAMLSSVLNSERAIQMNIQIIRIFTKMKEMALTHSDILLKLESLEKQSSKHSQEIQAIFKALKQLVQTPKIEEERVRIGFKKDKLKK
jgi:arsenate reductase-like glutaredoxin family protein